jgi:L-seryl-tRNA(Ser) seleniumtransferase
MKDLQTNLRRIPAVDRVLLSAPLAELAGQIPHITLRAAAQSAIDACRNALRAGAMLTDTDLSPEQVAIQARIIALKLERPGLRPVINASGTLLHTNLGRAPLSTAAIAAAQAVASGYSNLEFDLVDGHRGHRDTAIESLLCRLTGAEAATVVNNNAGAVLLALAALAGGREAIVSRGELVEIGGAFRIPEVMTAGGVRLREVGTTNKTHLHDYAAAIGPETGLLLKVHTSNYRVVGFTASVPASELVTLGQREGVLVMEDLGSGMLLDPLPFGLPAEPTVPAAVATGIDVVTFSGDKLLGGPQAGLIVGRKAAIETLRRHPLARALRCDKMTLAALEATLQLYLDPHAALQQIPVLQMLTTTADELQRRCRRLARQIQNSVGKNVDCKVIKETSAIGGGALPLTELPGYAVALTPHTLTVDTLAARLRGGEPAVVGRIHDGALLLNLRTVTKAEEKALVAAVSVALTHV